MNDRINVTKSSMPPKDEFFSEIESLWDTKWLTNMGEKHNQFERELSNYLQTPNISLMVNGHMALEMTIQAFRLSGEVITTPYTFASTTHAIVRNGLTPVFCDIDENDYTIDVEQIEKLITPRTTAILPVHVYGNICNDEEIERIARKYGLKVIYDAAHAFGVEVDGKTVANYGDASIYSFHATKVFNTIEGGAAVFHDKEVGERLYNLKNFGIHGPERVESVGANAKMNEFQAAMGICNLRHVSDEIAKRKAVYKKYLERLGNVSGIKVNIVRDNVKANYAYFPIFVDASVFRKSRNEIQEDLMRNNIFSRKYFYPLTSEFECYKDKFNIEDTPVALRASRQVLCLPMFADLNPEEVDLICDIVLK